MGYFKDIGKSILEDSDGANTGSRSYWYYIYNPSYDSKMEFLDDHVIKELCPGIVRMRDIRVARRLAESGVLTDCGGKMFIPVPFNELDVFSTGRPGYCRDEYFMIKLCDVDKDSCELETALEVLKTFPSSVQLWRTDREINNPNDVIMAFLELSMKISALTSKSVKECLTLAPAAVRVNYKDKFIEAVKETRDISEAIVAVNEYIKEEIDKWNSRLGKIEARSAHGIEIENLSTDISVKIWNLEMKD